MKPIAVIAAPNGARKQKSDHPMLPITMSEIVEDAQSCRDAGAAMIHVHARDHEGKHSLDIEVNQALYDELNNALGDSVMIQLTTEAIGEYSPQQQIALIKQVKPKAASFALRELFPDGEHVTTQFRQSAQFFDWVSSEHIFAQYILYDRQDVEVYLKLCGQGVIPATHRHVLLVLGRYSTTQTATPIELIAMLSDPALTAQRWGVCAFGQYEHQCLSAAMLLGGDVRVGFENNHLDRHGELAQSNAAQITELKRQAEHQGIATLNAQDYRSLLQV